MRFRDPNEPSNAVIPIGTYCPACHEDAVAVNNHKNNKKWRILDRLLCCIPRKERQAPPPSTSPPSPANELTCLACGFLFAPLQESYSRRNSDILESDKRQQQTDVYHYYADGVILPQPPPLRPPSSVWMRRTGFTPQPELLELMDHVWCGDCGLFVKRVSGTCCSKCGVALKSNL
ncbi:hypothetical protein BDB00DRAFT_877863 [Zychaea mexicana]|uniref:uncharacterized protein n=1 Tax=Zychaea mexicana TaxID=64656 RepID=UPI0022FE3509|nr:uncharacterized protein BDB00DRAFT_877863 [Zychaea mexicana]KAI9488019.1 hypothetical protein BDB00DRAFT_877863 [Zychaea mexicana]